MTLPAPLHTVTPSSHLHTLSSQCSVSCGQGVQRRNVGCQLGPRKAAGETECNPYTRPESERTCRAPLCPLYAWRAEEWQEVSRAMKWAPARHLLNPLPIITSVPGEAFEPGDSAGSDPEVCGQRQAAHSHPGGAAPPFAQFLCLHP